MIFKLIIVLYFCFVTLVNANSNVVFRKFKSKHPSTTTTTLNIVDLEYVKKSNNLPSSTLYYFDESNNLLYKNLNDNSTDNYSSYKFNSMELISNVPLKNPKILGSFSNNSMFFIGEKWYGDKITTKIHGYEFKPIFLIGGKDNHHHSMVLQDKDNITIYSMTNNTNFFSISIDTINEPSKNFSSDFIQINNNSSTSKIYTSKITIDPLYINTFKFSHDKLNNVYYSLIKEFNSNNVWVVKLENEIIVSYLLNINSDIITNDFNSILFGAFEDKVILYQYGNENQTLVSYDLIVNNVTNIIQYKNESIGFTKVYSKFNKDLMIYRDYGNGHSAIVSYSMDKLSSPYENSFNNTVPSGFIGQGYLLYREPISKNRHVYADDVFPEEANYGNGYDNNYNNNYDNDYNTDESNTSVLLIAILVPILSVSFLIGLGSLLYYIFVYRKRKLQRQRQHDQEQQQQKNDSSKDNEVDNTPIGGADKLETID